jgi:pimeloyl-ACP methyl ester carboxylesterase
MNVHDVGSGPPVVVVPGIQGRWEWMMPGIEALAARCRVVTFSLCDEPSSGGRFGRRSGFAAYVEQVREALDQCGLDAAAICGVSYGGLIAATFAARYPRRASGLILVSALPPSWRPDRRVRMYLRAPRLLAPVFWIDALFRSRPEFVAAVPRRIDRLRMGLTLGRRALRYRPSIARMARRARLAARMDPPALAGVRTPTLMVTGDPALDRVLPVRLTREYLKLIPQARVATLQRTGHFGIVTRSSAFADLVAPFVAEHDAAAGAGGARRHVV